MKLLTTLSPRRDGTVTLMGVDGARHVFAPDAAGLLTCDVPDEATIVLALRTSNFQPASEDDYETAEQLLEAADAAGKPDAEVDDDEDEDDDAPPPLPWEAMTPPAPEKRKPGRPRKQPAAR